MSTFTNAILSNGGGPKLLRFLKQFARVRRCRTPIDTRRELTKLEGLWLKLPDRLRIVCNDDVERPVGPHDPRGKR